MIRIAKNLGWIVAAMLLPLTSQAIEISVAASSSGGNAALLQSGDIITFDISVANASGEEINALGIGVRGHDVNQNGFADDGLTFVGQNEQNSTIPYFDPAPTAGTANVAETAFGFDNAGTLFGGITNIRGAGQTPQFSVLPTALTGQPIDLHKYSGSGLGAFEFGYNTPFNVLLGLPTVKERWVSVFDGVTTSFGVGQGSLTSTSEIAAGVNFRVSFEATTQSSVGVQHTLTFGEILDFGVGAITTGGATLTTYQSDAFTFTVIPEPSTALLMGLGLTALATRRRR